MWSHLLAFGPNLDVESSLKLQPAANNWGAITSKSWDSIILLGLHNFHTSPDNLQEIIPAIQLADVMVVMLFIIHSLIHFLPTGIPFPCLNATKHLHLLLVWWRNLSIKCMWCCNCKERSRERNLCCECVDIRFYKQASSSRGRKTGEEMDPYVVIFVHFSGLDL